MSANSATVRFGDLCEYDKRQGLHAGLPYLGLEHIESGSGQFDLSATNPDAKSQTFRFSGRHVLYGRLRPYLKKVALPDRDGRCSTEIFPILPKSGVERRYLAYWLLSDATTAAINATCTGARMPRADMDAVLDLPIYAPSLQEQRRIVALLDEAFAGIATAKANAEKSLRCAREVMDCYMQSVFSPENDVVELGRAFKTVTGATPPKSEAHYYGEFMPFVKPPELCDGELDGAADSLSESGAAVARTLPPHSVLVSCIGNLGKVGLNMVPIAFNQQINAILPDTATAVPKFMFFQALSRPFKEQLENLASGTTVPIVNKSKFNSIRVTVPSIQQQELIVERLEVLRNEVMRLESLYTRKLAALDELKQSLLQRAFSGQL